MAVEIVSVFTVTERSGKQFTEWVPGDGQQAIADVVKDYPRLTKFVLEGFELDGDFYPLDVRTYNRAR